MIEEDQLLQFAPETGCRLCCKEGWTTQHGSCEDWCRTFSATWDPNDPTKLFVCSQNGQLRIIDLYFGNYKEYHVLFRPFSSAFEGNCDDVGKIITSHWDKIVLVPERPGEIIFLLGISKVLMYTAVPGFPSPYPNSPMIARTTRGDSPDFLYGTPILELVSHSCRITALATSDDGHLSASGDEHGNVKICVLVRHMARKMSSSFCELKNSKAMLTPHGGPIFSIQWLPVTIPSSSTRNVHYVATGSADRAVRLWKVECCSEEGITTSIFCNFDSTSTHILSMHSRFISNQARSDWNRENTLANTSSRGSLRVFSDSHNSNNANNDKNNTTNKLAISNTPENSEAFKYSYRGNSQELYGADASVYLAAGTNTGCVYIWRIPLSDLETAPATSNVTIKNHCGNELHSLTQSSEYPVVQIAISLESLRRTMDLDSAMHRLLIVTSDTCACIRSHCAINMMDDNTKDVVDLHHPLNSTKESVNKCTYMGDNSARGGNTGIGLRPGPLGTIYNDAVLAFSLRHTDLYDAVLGFFKEPYNATQSATLRENDYVQVPVVHTSVTLSSKKLSLPILL